MRDIHSMMIRLGLVLLITLILGRALSSRAGVAALASIEEKAFPTAAQAAYEAGPETGFAAGAQCEDC